MSELLIQDKYLINFFTERTDGLGYQEVKANTVSEHLIIEQDLRNFLSQTDLNKENYRKLLRKYKNNEKELLEEIIKQLLGQISKASNMAIFINSNKSITFEGIKLYLFYPSGTELHGDKHFEQNIFSVVQELPYSYKHEGKALYSFRPDVTFFLNGIFIGYSELKSLYNNQSAIKHGRDKIANDYREAVIEYLKLADGNDVSRTIKKDFLKIFEKAIHITTTDLNETYILRSISTGFEDIERAIAKNDFEFKDYNEKTFDAFKAYPLRSNEITTTERFEEVFKALYAKKMIEKEILYYNFIERELYKPDGKKDKEYKEKTGRLISPRPKQKFGVDKIIDKVQEFLKHEQDDNYFVKQLKEQLKHLSEAQRNELINKRLKYLNNKNVFSLLLQYAAGFGKSNIIGWTALQLKDLKQKEEYVYDKVMLVVDRLQLRDQLDSKMHNMNVQKKMFIEASDQKSFEEALKSDVRLVVVNMQKFGAVNSIITPDVVAKLASLRIAFLIDEIHRSNSGTQHEEMVSLFDELQNSFDGNEAYLKNRKKKNLILGFTATPSDHTLARFGEFNKYAEAEKIWIPFDSYTMQEAIDDKFILNPLRGIVPVSAKMYFELPEDVAQPSIEPIVVNERQAKYSIKKKNIYENEDRIKAIAEFIVQRLVTSVYPVIGGYAKAMLAVSSIPAAIKYFQFIKSSFDEVVKNKKYDKYKNAPIHIVYSDSQGVVNPYSMNGDKNEEKTIQRFCIEKNGLIIVVDKLQTGFDEPLLHTLFLDKEISGINAIQTISRVNRTAKNKNDCKIIDFSYKNVNVNNIKKAFEHFSNVVVSDFDPLSDEKVLELHYQELKEHEVYLKNINVFKASFEDDNDVASLLSFNDSIGNFIRKEPDRAKNLKEKLNKYFYLLNLIQYVIVLEDKYSADLFVNFWYRYSNLYNTLTKGRNLGDDVKIYFDNRIGIVAPPPIPKTKEKPDGEGEDGGTGEGYKYDITKIIKKRNQEEAAIETMIEDFERKIELLFNFIIEHRNGIRLIAKIKDVGNAFSSEEIYQDFEIMYKAFIRRNREEIGEFFIAETKDIIQQLCDNFEKVVK